VGVVRRRQLDSCKCLKTIAGTSGPVRDGAVTVWDSNHRRQKFLRQERGGSLRTLVFLVFDRMSLRERALVKDTGDKNASAFLAVKYDVLAVFKTM
jgi:hypothetical protein